MKLDIERREFLKFMGVAIVGVSGAGSLIGCTKNTGIVGLQPDQTDDLTLSAGLDYKVLISWGDKINASQNFGYNNDYLDFISLSKTELLMWANHEYVNPLFVSGSERTKENVDKERKEIGGSIFHIQKNGSNWEVKKESKYNKRIDGTTKIPFHKHQILGRDHAIGTLGNCAGGKTPWGTILTCEENYYQCYGERNPDKSIRPSPNGWETIYPLPPEHYGWVVEIDLKTAQAKKHINLGRFAHESATTIISKSGHVVVYSGDDHNDEHVYKFVSKSNSDFDNGTLYVAHIEKGVWLPLDIDTSPILKKRFKTQVELLINTREAAKLLGATPLARPEDIEINPINGDIFVSLTNNKKKDNFHGSILKISETRADHSSLTFKAETFAFGGGKTKFSCPDNLCFDPKGNLWMTNDISGKAIGKEPYSEFGNNGLFVFPASGPDAGKAIQIASAPIDAELTGLRFSPDYKQLFLSVQHPGERSKSLAHLTSHWPTKNATPKPSVVVISGPIINQLTQ